MRKQTAVEWLVDELLSGKLLMPDLIEQAKQMEIEYMVEVQHLRLLVKDAIQMEKYQIQKAYDDSVFQFDDDISSEQYYQQTYGGNHE